MDASLDLLSDAALDDPEDLEIASAVAAHLAVLRRWRVRAHGLRTRRRSR